MDQQKPAAAIGHLQAPDRQVQVSLTISFTTIAVLGSSLFLPAMSI
jgi:hypothetical protein